MIYTWLLDNGMYVGFKTNFSFFLVPMDNR
jgi:hypothetical protein